MVRIPRNYLEFFIVDHCNFRCAHCSHSSPFMDPAEADLAEFRRDITALASVMEVDRFRILGGEPLLSPRLPEFIDAVRESGLSQNVGLCTNGALLHKAPKTTLTKLDWIDVTIYPGTTPDGETIRQNARSVAKEVGVKISVTVKEQFRHQTVDRPIPNPEVVQQIFLACQIAHGGWDPKHDGCHTVYRGHYFRCSRPAYARRFLERQGRNLLPEPTAFEDDGVCLHTSELRRRLVDYLLREEPLEACAWCLGTSGVKVPHRLMSLDEIRHPPKTERPLEEVLDTAALNRDQEALVAVRRRIRDRLLPFV